MNRLVPCTTPRCNPITAHLAPPLLPGAPAAELAAQQEGAPALSETDFDALELRNIGPAINGGRIADSDFHPVDPSVIYVGVGSGGVWRTENAGTTWTGPVR